MIIYSDFPLIICDVMSVSVCSQIWSIASWLLPCCQRSSEVPRACILWTCHPSTVPFFGYAFLKNRWGLGRMPLWYAMSVCRFCWLGSLYIVGSEVLLGFADVVVYEVITVSVYPVGTYKCLVVRFVFPQVLIPSSQRPDCTVDGVPSCLLVYTHSFVAILLVVQF